MSVNVAVNWLDAFKVKRCFTNALCFVICFLYVMHCAYAQTDDAVSPAPKKIVSNQPMSIAFDETHTLDIADILSAHRDLSWQAFENRSPNFGFVLNTLWLHVPLQDLSANRAWLLELGYPLLDEVDVYFVDQGEVVQHYSAGDQRAFNARMILHRNYLFDFPELNLTSSDLYVKVRSEGAMQVPLTIWDKEYFWQQEQTSLLVKGAFFGVVLVMIFYNLFVFSAVKDQSYLYYIGYAISIFLFQFSMDGLSFQYLWPHLIEWQQLSVVLFICFIAVFRCMFTLTFLHLPARWPAASWLLAILVLLSLLLISVSAFVPYNIAVRLSTALVLPSTLSCLFVGAYLLFKGVRRARYFVSGWLLYFVGAVAYALAKMGVIPLNNFTEYFLQIGIMAELVLFSMALADGINLERREKLQAQKVSIQNLERFKSLYDNAVEGIYQSDLSGNMLGANPAMARMLGYQSPQEFLDDFSKRGVGEFLDGGHYQDLTRNIMEKGKIHHFEIKGYRRDGQACWMSISAKVIPGKKFGGDAIVEGFVFDITQRKRNEEQLLFLSRHDPLTGLVNRREFESRLQMALDEVHYQDETHALLLLDLDQFKLVNDTCGHVAGDELLRQVTVLLRDSTRGGDVLARLGGDEFGIVLTNCSEVNASNVADKIRAQVQSMRFEWDGRVFSLAVSIGLVKLCKSIDSVKELINIADAACNSAKESGRNRVYVYDPATSDLAYHQTQMQWAARISESIERNLFQLYVQPIVSISGGEGSGASYEVLLRLKYDGEMVFPGTFLPAAERYNLMPKVDRWVVRNLFSWMAEHPEKTVSISDISINLSGLTLGDKEFPGYLREQFQRYKIPTEKICFEITETIAVTNLSSTLKFIEEFQSIGCSFSLDDFGSGFSSYGYLKNLPVDYLKIDGAFVKDMESSEIDCAMVESINRIGHVMGKKTIAEFVENDQISVMLQKIGVDYAQGYGISKPFPIDDIKAASSHS